MRTKRLTSGNAWLVAALSFALLITVGVTRAADPKKPNLILWGDDIGYWNLSAYNQRFTT